MDVLKTTSPAEEVSAPKEVPVNLVPSFRTRVAIGINGVIVGGILGVVVMRGKRNAKRGLLLGVNVV